MVHSQVSSCRPRTCSYYPKLRGHVIEVKLRSNRMLEQVIDYMVKQPVKKEELGGRPTVHLANE